MITVTDAFKQAFQSNNRFWKYKAQITRNSPNAVPIDISDRVISGDISCEWERRSTFANIELDNYDYALSPVNQASLTNQVAGVYDPLLDSNHILEIWEGILTTNGYEYVKKFTGLLGDEIDADTMPGVVNLTVRDKSKRFQDTYIYQSKTYSPLATPALTLAEKVIQDLITTFLPDEKITMAVDDPTNFVVGLPNQPYTAKDINLWDAIQQIADAFNFCVMFDENGILRMKNIIRDYSKAPSVHTFDESVLIKDSLSTSDSDVRNHIMLRVQGLDPIEKKDEESIAKYGRRYFEVHRSLSSILTTAEQGHRLVDNILADYAYVIPVDRIEVPLMPHIQCGDIVSLVNTRLGTNAITYKYRVVSLRDSFTNDKKRTTLTLHGYNAYKPSESIAPKPATNLTSTFITRAVQNYAGSGWVGYTKTAYYPMLKWNQPTQDISGNALSNDFGGYTIYRKGPADSQFFPVASVKSYIEAQNLIVNFWYDYTALAGANQYKIVAINKFGKSSAESSTISLTKIADAVTN
ncbi:hypothetical protein [Paenibacillus xylanexedens]|uniref:hypothetical protein n=1 Tax=Paenibacillus xylanexedens TaxID=528191 RepID=UPI000F52E586|nr:hypothetical protein [Paenibacillus xylanexedens]RPK20059.1 hypothetical protein EDO6_06576 [Paenibacillus xylanexedens]